MILKKDVLVNNIVTELSDNSTGLISPYDIRHNLLDIIDSVHLLARGYPLDGPNFRTISYQTTSVGENTLINTGLAGSLNRDNTAVGHSALKVNFQGVQNTAIGSQTLFCNVHGENNVALGFSALAGNTLGDSNVGLGNFTLHNNKAGKLNIAIGHGAGYYLKDQNSKFVLGSYNINSDFICANPEGSGIVPLLYGDLSKNNLRLGIATSSLNNEGVLQVNGAITPSVAQSHDLGSAGYRWRALYLSNKLSFSPNQYIQLADETFVDFVSSINVSGDVNVSGNFSVVGDISASGNISVSGNIIPVNTNSYNLGSPNNLWNYGYFDNIFVSGLSTFNRVVAYETCNVFCKSINLANSGSISLDGGGAESIYDYSHEPPPFADQCGYLSDEELYGAGFNINSSGVDYLRTYSFTFSPPSLGSSCANSIDPYSLAAWSSNISLKVAQGAHVQTDRVIFPNNLNLVQQPECFGIFSRNNNLFVSNQNLLLNQNPDEYLAGVGNVNFYSPSGSISEHIFSLAAPESGVTIKQRFLNGVKNKATDSLNNNLDKLTGFEIQYINDANGFVYGPSANRLVIGSYNNTSLPVNALSLMQGSQDEGLLCLTNLSPTSQNLLPATTFNIRSANNAIVRLTAENEADTKSAIQLVGELNCLANGFEAEYLNGSGVANLNMYKDFVETSYVRLYANNTIGFFSGSGQSNAMLTVGSPQFSNAAISMRQNISNVPASSGYGKVYVTTKNRPKQSHTAILVDGSGNRHDLVVNPLDVTDGRGLYTDPSGNTFGGLYCPDRRDDLDDCFSNTGLGSGVLFSITNGDFNSVFGAASASSITTGSRNTVLGSHSASGITTGNRNTIIGSYNASGIVSGSRNIVIGQDSFNAASGNVNNNIVIGNNITKSFNTDNNFVVGNGSVILLEGRIGPTDAQKFLSIPRGGNLTVYDATNANATLIKSKEIELYDDSGNDYPNNPLTFSFRGEKAAELLRLNHGSNPMTNTPNYQSPQTARPFAELLGDLKLRGAIRFSDRTSLDSANFLDDIQEIQTYISNLQSIITVLNNSFVEGYTASPIAAPTSPNSPTQGVLQVRNKNWVVTGEVILTNRDIALSIHQGAYVIAILINDEYRPLWISAKDTTCECCSK